MKKYKFIFDLDDTLYKECNYVISAFKFMGRDVKSQYGVENLDIRLMELFEQRIENPINVAWKEFGLSEDSLLPAIEKMQMHVPDIALDKSAQSLIFKLRAIGSGFCIVTDGRSTTQRAKILALGVGDAEIISISEETGASKPSEICFKEINQKYHDQRLIYVGDNPRKDFFMPNKMGWKSVMLVDDGSNVHSQVKPLSRDYAPQEIVDDLCELERYL